MLGLLGLAKGALDGGGMLGGILQTGADLLGEILKGGEQQQPTDPFNAGAGGDAGLLNAANCFKGDGAAQNPAANLRNFLDVAKTLLDQLKSSEGANGASGANAAANNAPDAQTAKLKDLLEKLVKAFEQFAADQNGANAASNGSNAAPANSGAAQNNGANNAAPAQSNAASNNQAADQAANAQGANNAENSAEARNPLQQIVDLLKQLFETLTGKKFDAENNAENANGANNAAQNNAASDANNAAANNDGNADAAQAQNPLQQIADLLKRLLDELKNKQGAENANNAAADNSANNATNSAEQPQQTSQANQAAAPQQADGSGEPDAAKLQNTVQQVLQLLQNMLQAFQANAGNNNQQPAQNRNSNVDNNVRPPQNAAPNGFVMFAEQRFEAHMTARV